MVVVTKTNEKFCSCWERRAWFAVKAARGTSTQLVSLVGHDGYIYIYNYNI